MFVFEKPHKQLNEKNTMADIWAKNAKGEKRRFTDVAWKFLPVDADGSRNGWFAMPDSTTENITPTVKLEKPSTGQVNKTVIIENKVEKQPEVVIENIQNKEEFLKAMNGVKKGDVKDYFDKNNIEYKNNASTSELVNQLGEHLKFDIIALQKALG